MRFALALMVGLVASAVQALPIERCVNLSNFLEVPRDEGWVYDFDPSHIDAIAEAGFDTLRLPLNVGDHWVYWRIDPRFRQLMLDTVARARAAGLYVIVDLHHYDRFIADPDAHGDEFVAIWAALSEVFKDQDGLAFELLNEPTDAVSTDQMLPFYARALAEIRVHHPKAWVIYGGAEWNGLWELKHLPAEDDPFVAHTFHYYSPFEFTHQGAEWVGRDMPPTDFGTKAEIAKIRDDFDLAKSHHTPLFLGEFGVYHPAKRDQRLAWLKLVRETSEAAGIPWCHWGFGAGFGLFDPDTNRWDNEALRALVP